MGKFIDLTGKQFDRWTVLEKSGLDSSGKINWLCKCECGVIKEVAGKSLREKRSRSCGCFDYKNNQDKHLMRDKPEYKIWKAMRVRCNNKNADNYKHYGGRGIKVCKEWDSFPRFFNDMGERPSDKHSIDRIDVNGNYEPSNCRWATWDVQQLNKRK